MTDRSKGIIEGDLITYISLTLGAALCLLLSGCAISPTTPTTVTEAVKSEIVAEGSATETDSATVDPVPQPAPPGGWMIAGPHETDVPWSDTYNREWLWAVTNALGHRIDVTTMDSPIVNGGAVTDITTLRHDGTASFDGTTAFVKVGVKAGQCGRREVHLEIDGRQVAWVLLKFPRDCVVVDPPRPPSREFVCPPYPNEDVPIRTHVNGVATYSFTVKPLPEPDDVVRYSLVAWSWPDLGDFYGQTIQHFVNVELEAGPHTLTVPYTVPPGGVIQTDLYRCTTVTGSERITDLPHEMSWCTVDQTGEAQCSAYRP